MKAQTNKEMEGKGQRRNKKKGRSGREEVRAELGYFFLPSKRIKRLKEKTVFQ